MFEHSIHLCINHINKLFNLILCLIFHFYIANISLMSVVIHKDNISLRSVKLLRMYKINNVDVNEFSYLFDSSLRLNERLCFLICFYA